MHCVSILFNTILINFVLILFYHIILIRCPKIIKNNHKKEMEYLKESNSGTSQMFLTKHIINIYESLEEKDEAI